uniref:B box-type domain-containing protein n=1 Tax=Oryza brachyantha TaxID=4533 RepID=J3KXF2_ORYBR
MKVLCSGCEAAEARVLCCADDAALCPRCDRDVHAANRLAGKHHRLPLLSSSSSSSAPAAAASSSPPNCDICQESHAYFFCVEDRALLCRSCDVAVHTANAFVSAHRRFLLTGVQVGLDPAAADDDNQPDPEPHNNNASSAPPLQPPPQCARKRSPSPLYSDDDVIDWATGGQAVSITGNLPDWSVVNEQFSTPAPAVGQAAEPVVTKTPPKRSSRGPVTPATAAAGVRQPRRRLAGLAARRVLRLRRVQRRLRLHREHHHVQGGQRQAREHGRHAERQVVAFVFAPRRRRPGLLRPGAGRPLGRAGAPLAAHGLRAPLATGPAPRRRRHRRRRRGRRGLRAGHLLAGESLPLLRRRRR